MLEDCAGMTYTQAANKLKTSPTTIQNAAKRYDLVDIFKHPKEINLTAEYLLMHTDKNYAQIARLKNCNTSSVRHAINRLGLRPNFNLPPEGVTKDGGNSYFKTTILTCYNGCKKTFTKNLMNGASLNYHLCPACKSRGSAPTDIYDY